MTTPTTRKPLTLVSIDGMRPWQWHYMKELCTPQAFAVVDINGEAFLVSDDFRLAVPADGRRPGFYSVVRGTDRSEATEYARILRLELAA